MSLTYAQAVDDILTLLNVAWTPTGHQMDWDNTRKQKETDNSPWASVVVRHASGQQDSLGGVGNRMFLRLGIIMVMIHVPTASGLSEPYALAKVVADAYEGVSSPNGVWFRNVRVNERGRDGSNFALDVVIDFEYTETK